MATDLPPPPGDRDAATVWVAAGEVRARRLAATAAAELDVAEDERLDDRTRIALREAQIATVQALVSDVRSRAARLLKGRGEAALAVQIEASGAIAGARLLRAGLLVDLGLIDEMLAQVRLSLLQSDLPPRAGSAGVPSLLVRLSRVKDRAVAAAAAALMTAESRRLEAGGAALPAELHHRLVWLVAAALRDEAGRLPAGDQAIGEAAQRSLATADEGKRVEALAMRLALAIDARPDELEALFDEALGDGRLTLVAAVLAVATGMDFDQARALLVDPDARRLGLALRGLGLSRVSIAGLLLALAEADSRRDPDALPDQVDALVGKATEEAWESLAPLRLSRDYRAAIRTLEDRAA